VKKCPSCGIVLNDADRGCWYCDDDFSTSKTSNPNAMVGFAYDQKGQRCRRITADNQHELQQKIAEIEVCWREENSYSIKYWKKEVLCKTPEFPLPPKPQSSIQYHSAFLPLNLASLSSNKVHLDEYSLFVSSIQNANSYRLSERIPKSAEYPVEKPRLPNFPSIEEDFRVNPDFSKRFLYKISG